jgi:HAD superfamily hydrolase (TIGR01509 family)
MIKAAIFDMDGLLIDSEPLWQEAEILVFNKVGVPLKKDMTTQTTGLRTDEVVAYWHKRFPWDLPSQADVRIQIDEKVLELIKQKGTPMPGVRHAVETCLQSGLVVAVASSSPSIMIKAVVEKLDISDRLELIHSAEFESHGKPHPAVYITTAEKLGVHPDECVALEDSVNGVLSAKAAKMRCIAIPDQTALSDKRYGIADFILDSLEDLTETELTAQPRSRSASS